MNHIKKLNINLQRVDWAAIGLIALLAVLYAWTLMAVPFHPDETTHIYMSKDFESLFKDPLSLSWSGKPLLSDEERIRAIDAPLAKYLIGASRVLFSIPPLAADWDWSLSWEENRAASALPSSTQLLNARAAITFLLPFSLWLYYQAFKKILPGIPALAAVLLLGLNPLVLLHGRRAMSEGIYLVGIAFFLWAITRDHRNPWLIGLAAGLCFNAKHSALGLLPAAFLGVLLVPTLQAEIQKTFTDLFKVILVFFLSFLLLNPFYWKQPIPALTTGVAARLKLAGEQQADHLGHANKLQKSIPGLLLNAYFTPPQTEEVGNYLPDTQAARENYLNKPIHTLGRGVIGGSILLVLTLAGMGRALWSLKDQDPTARQGYLILAVGTLGILSFTIFLLPWQRYVIPLLPFIYFWIGAGLSPILQAIIKESAAAPPE